MLHRCQHSNIIRTRNLKNSKTLEFKKYESNWRHGFLWTRSKRRWNYFHKRVLEMSPEPKFGANVSANLHLKPELSQVSIIVLLIISGASFLTSFYFSWHEKSWWLPAITGSVCLVLSGIAWWRSQRAVDLGNSSPTEISGTNGLRVITDTRTIDSESAANNLARIIETISLRQPLPPASGIVSENGDVLDNSEADGRKATEEINSLIKTKIGNLESSCIIDQLESAEKAIIPPIDQEIEVHSGIAIKKGRNKGHSPI